MLQGAVDLQSLPPASGARWRVGDRSIDLSRHCIMGILNATADSFSDGGRYATVDIAIEAGLGMIADGAAIVDIGAESTRPGAQRVDAGEQIARAIPVIEGIIASSPQAVVSIDTTLAPVAEAALDAGARIINDVSAGLEDPRMLALAASRSAGLILMHRLAPPDQDRFSDQYAAPPAYGDVVDSVWSFLGTRVKAALAAGVTGEAIVVDPGLGFGKSVEQNYELIAARQAALPEHPMLGAASRKSFLGAMSGERTPERRLAESIAVAVAQSILGIRLFRVHDVAAHRRALAVTQAIIEASNRRHDREPRSVLRSQPTINRTESGETHGR